MIEDTKTEFRRHQRLINAALSALSDEAFFMKPADAVNSIAQIVKHLAGNFHSRWTDFLTTDGDKPDRNRDREFIIEAADTRQAITQAMNAGWAALWATLDGLTDADLHKTVMIRGEPHTVQQALLRSVTHTAWHVGQILYLSRLMQPGSPWLTIAPGASAGHTGAYLKTDRAISKPA